MERVISSATFELWATLSFTSAIPLETMAIFWAISLVALDCSSMAAAMVVTMVLISVMTVEILSISSTEIRVEDWISSICSLISWVEAAVCLARSLISLATTAKPFPASTALAASMVAFKARRLVCSEMSVMVSVTLPMAWATFPRRTICSPADLDWFTALSVMVFAVSVFFAISLMVAVISSTAVTTEWVFSVEDSIFFETLPMLALISFAARDTVSALSALRAAVSETWSESPVRSPAEALSWSIPVLISITMLRKLLLMVFMLLTIMPSSSLLLMSRRCLKSPPATVLT